jgi:AcrR family transcriptional regulator
MSLREMKMERTRELIGEVAFALFRDKGFAATTVEEIAAAAEVGARTVYRHYPTKEMLALSGFAEVFETALADLRACPEDAAVPDVLHVILESVLRSHLKKPEQLLTAYTIAQDTPSVLAHFAYTMRDWQAELRHEVAERIGGRSADVTAEFAVAQTASVFALAFRKWFESDGRADLRRLTGEILELLRSGDVPIPAPMS